MSGSPITSLCSRCRATWMSLPMREAASVFPRAAHETLDFCSLDSRGAFRLRRPPLLFAKHGGPKTARTTTWRSCSTRRALQQDPNETNARTGLQRARLRASQDHFTQARRLAGHRAARRSRCRVSARRRTESGQSANAARARRPRRISCAQKYRSGAMVRPSSKRWSNACAISPSPASPFTPIRCRMS